MDQILGIAVLHDCALVCACPCVYVGTRRRAHARVSAAAGLMPCSHHCKATRAVVMATRRTASALFILRSFAAPEGLASYTPYPPIPPQTPPGLPARSPASVSAKSAFVSAKSHWASAL